MLKYWPHFKNKQAIILVIIVLLAAALRLYRINEIPYGFYWDEAAITYNAWGLAVWNRDEFGNKLPVSFKSFGDYKAPLLIYVLGGIYKVTGLHPEYLRVLIAISGIMIVALTFFVAKEYERQKKLPQNTAPISAFFMAITPWAINFSRFGVEATLALLLFLVGLLFLERSKNKKRYIYAAAFFFALCLYTYHSVKVVIPLFLLVWSLFNKTFILKHKKSILVATIIGAFLLYPLLRDTFFGSGFERGKSLIFFKDDLSLLPQNLLSFLSLDFWVNGKDAIGLRHSVPGFGVLLKTVFALLIIGMLSSLKKKQNYLLIIWAIIGLLPSILSADAPHAIRSLMAMPAIILLAAFGLKILPKVIKPIAVLIILIETGFYLHSYYGSYAADSATAFQYGYKEAILAAEKIADAEDKIIVTDYYGQPYIYTLLYRKLTPEEFKFGALANYEFRPITWPDENSNRIFIATPEEIPTNEPKVSKVISIPNTTKAVFVIIKNP
jgi:hypothetical protein